MTHFEAMLVEAIRDLSKEVHAGTSLLARLDERSADHERRLGELEEHTPAPSTSRRKRRLGTAKDVGIGAASVVALATALLQALSGPSAPPAPKAPTAVTGAP